MVPDRKSLLGAVIGLYLKFLKRPLACLLAFAAGSLISALAIEQLLEVAKKDFERLVANDRQLADAVTRISHQRAISNLSAGGTGAAVWAKVTAGSLDLDRRETGKLLTETAKVAGIASRAAITNEPVQSCSAAAK